MKTHIFTLSFLLTCLIATSPLHAEESKPDANLALDKLTPNKKSALEEKMEKVREASQNPLSITFYRPTYILPFYYTGSPYATIYKGNTPDNQAIKRSEFKSQFSLYTPLFSPLFNDPNSSLNIAYTQVNYWQVYANSQYFRETNYEPEIFWENHFHRNWLARIGLNHQSNGRGGDLERSWNRAIASVQFSGNNWLVDLKTWALIFKAQSANLHNSDIVHYLGHENLMFSYKFHDATLSFETQNLESGLKRGHIQFTASYPILKHIAIYGQYFNGYGQSLIEYNHRTQSAGIGIALRDWI